MSKTVSSVLQQLLRTHLAEHPTPAHVQQLTHHDPNWTSPCEIGPPDARGMIYWRPAPQAAPFDFAPLERQLGVPIRSELKEFFTAYWSRTFEIPYEDTSLYLTLCWNEDELQRLTANLRYQANRVRGETGHLAFTVAATADNRSVVVRNSDGKVLMEGFDQPARLLASDLPTFLESLIHQ